ncbi:hypothetical protein K435DRAFT_799253 [Dendrothele bispora CBS 962.96]|uniref:Uncharacterized protein n=1 Tax=Dendrothele bispora (strain CBS 962.96) TaxID=1314807 RepID=A0A4S8LXS9_DENBC|nr:hypothetical protein K435DRAFT_799253 [Dendrothele bispora CBS 962.96]
MSLEEWMNGLPPGESLDREDPSYGYYVLGIDQSFLPSAEWDSVGKYSKFDPSGSSILAVLSPTAEVGKVFDDASVPEFAFATLRDSSNKCVWIKCLETKGTIAGVNGTAKDNKQQYVLCFLLDGSPSNITTNAREDHKATLSAPYIVIVDYTGKRSVFQVDQIYLPCAQLPLLNYDHYAIMSCLTAFRRSNHEKKSKEMKEKDAQVCHWSKFGSIGSLKKPKVSAGAFFYELEVQKRTAHLSDQLHSVVQKPL